MSAEIELLREEFETLTVDYVTRLGSPTSLQDIIDRRGNDGNYWCHSLCNSMWIGFLVGRIGLDRVLVHLKFTSIH